MLLNLARSLKCFWSHFSWLEIPLVYLTLFSFVLIFPPFAAIRTYACWFFVLFGLLLMFIAYMRRGARGHVVGILLCFTVAAGIVSYVVKDPTIESVILPAAFFAGLAYLYNFVKQQATSAQ